MQPYPYPDIADSPRRDAERRAAERRLLNLIARRTDRRSR